MSDPYRQMVPLTKKQVDGLIVVPYQKPPKPHQCEKPSPIWRALCFWLPRFAGGTLFRCPKCKEVWLLRSGYDGWLWEQSAVDRWIRAGGVE